MFIGKIVEMVKGVCAEQPPLEENRNSQRLAHTKGSFFPMASILSALLLFVLTPSISHGAVNVYMSTAAPVGLQSDFINATTAQFNARVVPAIFGNVNVTLFSKQSDYVPVTPSTDVVTLGKITEKLTEISTWTYVYGWADGRDYTRDEIVDQIGRYVVNCSSPTYFDAPVEIWSSTVCATSLLYMRYFVSEIKISTSAILEP